MSHHYLELFYHFVWGTKHKWPLINSEVEPILFAYLQQRCNSFDVVVYAMNGISDHIHLACSVPPKISIADFVEGLKGASSHYINHLPDWEHKLYWQEGYGALTFSKQDLPRVVRYIQKQKDHHDTGRLSEKMELTHG